MPDQFVPERILGVLVEHGVRFVLIGGMGAVAHGSHLLTEDVDVTPESSRANLDRLADALRALDARIRHPDIPEGLAFSCDATSLAAAIFWNLTTPFGDLDISFTPAATTGYASLMVDAEPLTFRGVDVQLASLEAIVRSKAAANRPKDLRALPVLRELLAQQRERRLGLRAGQLAVATPQLGDPNFVRTVVLLLQVNDDGALGVVLNRPTETEVAEVLPLWAPLAAAPAAVFAGGPVQPQAAICLGRGRPGGGGSAAFAEVEGLPEGAVGTVDLDSSPEDLHRAVSEVRLFAGYAGWSAGQLQAEIDDGAWWTLDALPADAFALQPELLWRQVLLRQGAPIAFAASYPADPKLN